MSCILKETGTILIFLMFLKAIMSKEKANDVVPNVYKFIEENKDTCGK